MFENNSYQTHFKLYLKQTLPNEFKIYIYKKKNNIFENTFFSSTMRLELKNLN